MSSAQMTDKQFQAALLYCRTLGAAHGEGNAEFQSQYWPGGGRDTGRDTTKRAKAMLADLESGRIEAPCPLSGEWADGLTPSGLAQMVAEHLGCTVDDGEESMQLADEYELAYQEAWNLECERILWDMIQQATEGDS